MSTTGKESRTQETPVASAVRAIERQRYALLEERAETLEHVELAIRMVVDRSPMGALNVLRQIRKTLKKKAPER